MRTLGFSDCFSIKLKFGYQTIAIRTPKEATYETDTE